MARVQLVLSTVTAEFLTYREHLRHLLTRPNVEVKVQEDFIVTGDETLEMLDTYTQGCDGAGSPAVPAPHVSLPGHTFISQHDLPAVSAVSRVRHDVVLASLAQLAEALRRWRSRAWTAWAARPTSAQRQPSIEVIDALKIKQRLSQGLQARAFQAADLDLLLGRQTTAAAPE